MTYAVVGKCPHCGAPIYQPFVQQGILPPPVTHTCDCRFRVSTESFWDQRIGPGTVPDRHAPTPTTDLVTDQDALDLLTKAMEDDDEFEMTEPETLEDRVAKLEIELEKIRNTIGSPKKALKKKAIKKRRPAVDSEVFGD